jgi:hypothetical protein
VIPFDRDASSADALLTDLYLDAILAGRSLRGELVDAHADAPGTPGSAALDGPSARLDPAIRAASERLRHDLVRVHPSFRFEERLAMRLAEAAAQMRIPTAVGAEGRVVPFRAHSGAPSTDLVGGETLLVGDEQSAPTDLVRHDLPRPLLIGGALTSAALSLAGAAIVAWRWTRPASQMSRAARAVREAREAAATAATHPFGSRRPH